MASKNWGRQGMPEKAEHKVLVDEDLTEKLQNMSMTQIRAYARKHNLKAKDTSKPELITEILTELQLN